MKRRLTASVCALIVLTALSAAFFAAGCGSGEEAQAALTKAQYRKKANLICNKASIEQFKLGSEYLGSHPGAEEADAIEPAVLPPLEKQLRQLQELPLPEGYEEQIESYLAALEEALEESKKDPQSLLAKQDNPFKKTNALGKRYQLGDCGLNP